MLSNPIRKADDPHRAQRKAILQHLQDIGYSVGPGRDIPGAVRLCETSIMTFAAEPIFYLRHADLLRQIPLHDEELVRRSAPSLQTLQELANASYVFTMNGRREIALFAGLIAFYQAEGYTALEYSAALAAHTYVPDDAVFKASAISVGHYVQRRAAKALVPKG